MATYFVASGGSNTAPYDTWAKAATTIQTALAAASTSGDIIVLQYNGLPSADSEVGAATTYTATNNIKIISASNNGGSSYTPTIMGTSYWLGNSSTNRSLTINGPYSIFIYGVTFRTAGTTAANMAIGNAVDIQLTMDTCYIYHGNVSASAVLRFGPAATNSANAFIKFRKCTFRLGHTSQAFRIAATTEMEDCIYDTGGSVPAEVVQGSDSSDPGGAAFTAIGCDFSYASSGANLVADTSKPIMEFNFIQCKLPTSYVSLAAQTVTNKSAARVWVFDCASGDLHGIIEYADSLGSMVTDSGIYYTTTPSTVSWKIITTANCSDISPFETPWVDWYNTTLTSMLPRFEILRDGSASAFTNAEVWSEFFIKSTSGFAKSSFYTNRVVLAASPSNLNAGAGLGSWTGESGTAWSGKVDSLSNVTPAEIGMVRGRVCVGIPSTTLYVDPYIRIA